MARFTPGRLTDGQNQLLNLASHMHVQRNNCTNLVIGEIALGLPTVPGSLSKSMCD